MPKYDVTLRYKVEYLATKTLTAKTEEAAQERAENDVAAIATLAAFETYVNGDIDEDVNEVEIEEVNEA